MLNGLLVSREAWLVKIALAPVTKLYSSAKKYQRLPTLIKYILRAVVKRH